MITGGWMDREVEQELAGDARARATASAVSRSLNALAPFVGLGCLALAALALCSRASPRARAGRTAHLDLVTFQRDVDPPRRASSPTPSTPRRATARRCCSSSMDTPAAISTR